MYDELEGIAGASMRGLRHKVRTDQKHTPTLEEQ